MLKCLGEVFGGGRGGRGTAPAVSGVAAFIAAQTSRQAGRQVYMRGVTEEH